MTPFVSGDQRGFSPGSGKRAAVSFLQELASPCLQRGLTGSSRINRRAATCTDNHIRFRLEVDVRTTARCADRARRSSDAGTTGAVR